jgi:hypothetical protein
MFDFLFNRNSILILEKDKNEHNFLENDLNSGRYIVVVQSLI